MSNTHHCSYCGSGLSFKEDEKVICPNCSNPTVDPIVQAVGPTQNESAWTGLFLMCFLIVFITSPFWLSYLASLPEMTNVRVMLKADCAHLELGTPCKVKVFDLDRGFEREVQIPDPAEAAGLEIGQQTKVNDDYFD